MSRTLIVGLGGTIAMAPGAEPGIVPKLTAEMLVAAVPQLRDHPGLEAMSFRLIPGAHLSFDDIDALADLIRTRAAEGVTGVVITQGTDTIEETAFALDCLLDLDIPVVVTGAMRNPSLPGADGPANLLAAVTVATTKAARGLGVLVVMNDTIHSAQFVVKRHTTACDAFVSASTGPLGYLSEGDVQIGVRPVRRASICGPVSKRATVALFTLSLDDRGDLITAALGAGFDGFVIAGVGGGHASAEVAEVLSQAATSIPVILSSRAGAGHVLCRTYGFAGGEVDLIGKGLIPSGALGPVQARVALILMLRRGKSQEDITSFFSAY